MMSRVIKLLLFSTAALSVSAAAARVGAPVRAMDFSPAAPATNVPCSIDSDTVLRAADSPYDIGCDVAINAGATLTIEAGVAIIVAANRGITVLGSVRAVGTEAAPIVIDAPSADTAWLGMQIDAGAGPSELRYVEFHHVGARQKPAVETSSSDLVIANCVFEDSGGSGVDLRNGASPTIEGSNFVRATAGGAHPTGALRIFGASHAVVRNNVFQGNIIAVYQEALASPAYEGNRFILNGLDGVRLDGQVKGHTTLSSLGPRKWRYAVAPAGLTVQPDATLEVLPGATIAFESQGILVHGTLRIRGESAAKVLLTTVSDDPQPGRWGGITLYPDSADYDDETGEGTLIDHAVIEYGGREDTGSIFAQGSSPRISNTLIRDTGTRGLTASLSSAAPTLVGVRVVDATNPEKGIGLAVNGGALPTVAFSVFQHNTIGVQSDGGANPILGPFNRFDRNTDFGVENRDGTQCLEASHNDWIDPSGPYDPSPNEDACGLGSNDGLGGFVSDNVSYAPWDGRLARPYFTAPHCGALRSVATIEGMGPSGASILIYDNYGLLGETSAETSDEEYAPFAFEAPDLEPGSHVLIARAEEGELASGISDPAEINIDPDQLVDPSAMHVSYDLDGLHYAQGVNDLTGCSSLQGGGWDIRVHPGYDDPTVGETTTVHIPIQCPSGPATAALDYLDQQIPLAEGSEGMFTGDFEPKQGGAIALDMSCGGSEQHLLLGTVSVEYNGFVYDLSARGDEVEKTRARVGGAEVRLYRLQPGAGWILWDAPSYFDQTNPQVTGPLGWYGFYPPPGTYRVQIIHPKFVTYTSAPTEITTGPFMLTVGLERKPQLYLPALSDG